MTPTTFELIAVVMAVVTVAIFVWFRWDRAAGSAARMARMMWRAGLDPRIGKYGTQETMAALEKARRRCRRCPTYTREDLCEQWLAGEIEGDNGFCPNAGIFRDLHGKTGPLEESTDALIDR